ncbi:MAG: hypothetical protein J2P33_12360 [Actinobacteria bacterium]|nr:hypothetical protein [Actinomycetota bacterium]
MKAQARLRRRNPVATRDGVRALLEGNRRRVSSAWAQRELGVTFRPLQETISDEAAWYREQGVLPPWRSLSRADAT